MYSTHGIGAIKMTKSEKLLELIRKIKQEVHILLGGSYEQEDLSRLIKDLGSQVEIFLKDAVYGSLKNRSNYYELINELSQLGVDTNSINDLHELRLAYNKCKHQPDFIISYAEAYRITNRTENAIENIKLLNIDSSNNIATTPIKRVFWLAAFDILHTGETVINIMIPKEEEGESDFIPFHNLELFNIKWEGWEPFKEKFETKGSLHLGKQFLPEKVYEFLSNESEFIDAGVYDGDYQALVLFLSSYIDLTLENKLFFEDRRASNENAILSSFLMSGVDIISQLEEPVEIDFLEENILITATYKYAIPKNSEYIKRYLHEVAKLFKSIPLELRNRIIGPFWLRNEKYKELLESSGIITSENIPVFITQEGKLYTSST